jgi:hypothetical protein
MVRAEGAPSPAARALIAAIRLAVEDLSPSAGVLLARGSRRSSA